MAAEATVGLMLWDGQSRGTLLNVLRLAAEGKPVVVYMARDRTFVEVRAENDLASLLAKLDRGALKQVQAGKDPRVTGKGASDPACPTVGGAR